jgi:hypothetical protein
VALGKDKARSMLRHYKVKGAVFLGAVGARDVLMRFFCSFFRLASFVVREEFGLMDLRCWFYGIGPGRGTMGCLVMALVGRGWVVMRWRLSAVPALRTAPICEIHRARERDAEE